MLSSIRYHRALLAPLLVALLSGCSPQPELTPSVLAPPPPPPVAAILPGQGIRYTLSIPEPRSHLLQVSASYPTGGRGALELVMANWTPGSYKIRDYARQVEGLSASGPDGAALAVEKTAKNRWRVETDGASEIGVRYQVWCRELSVRTSWVEEGFAMLNGASVFLTDARGLDQPHAVTLALPEGWDVAVSLPLVDGARVAEDYDALVDAPILAGDLDRSPFTVDGAALELVSRGAPESWDGAASADDLQRLVRAQVDLWGVLPFRRYLFLSVVDQGGGGLEHKNSTLTLTTPWRAGDRASYLGWLGLMSHEFFHTWNVKRLRPEALGPFDYEHEVYTPSLWVAEGITSYYGDLLLVRAGLMTAPEYLSRLSDDIRAVQSTPGRAVRSLSQASYDAWIKHYQPSPNNQNTSVSYYQKGAVVAFLLDAEIRRLSGGARSLDDVMRLAYARYSGARGFAPQDFRVAASEVAGQDLSAWFAAAVDGTGELDYDRALAQYGLKFEAPPVPSAPAQGWHGASLSGAVVSAVPRGTPADSAGLDLQDELIAVDGWRVNSGTNGGVFEHYKPGDRVTVTLARRGRLLELPLILGQAPDATWSLAIDPAAPGAASSAREAWLSAATAGR